jgi:hypothetical protein
MNRGFFAVLLRTGEIEAAASMGHADQVAIDRRGAALFKAGQTHEWRTVQGCRSVDDKLAQWAAQESRRSGQ